MSSKTPKLDVDQELGSLNMKEVEILSDAVSEQFVNENQTNLPANFQEVVDTYDELDLKKAISKDLKFSPKCKMCNIAVTYPFVYRDAVNELLKGATYPLVRETVVDLLSKEQVPEAFYPTRKAVWEHFTNHMEFNMAVDIAASRPDSRRDVRDRKLVDPDTLMVVDLGQFDEYKELCKLYVGFKSTSDKIYEFTKSLQADTGQAVWSPAKIATYTAMINAQRAILTEIAKMRQSERLVSLAAKFVLESYTKSLVEKVQQELAVFTTLVRRQGVDSGVVDSIEFDMRERLSNILINEADAAMQATKKEFKLPN